MTDDTRTITITPKPERYRVVMPDGTAYEFEAWEEETARGTFLRIVGDITIKPPKAER